MSHVNKVISNNIRHEEVDTNPHSISGHIGMKDMGTNVVRSVGEAPRAKPKPQDEEGFLGGSIEDIEDLTYYPTTDHSKQVYSKILTRIHEKLPDSSHAVVVSAVDVTLEILMNDIEAHQKRHEVEILLGETLDDIEFNDILAWAKEIDDYKPHEDEDREIEVNLSEDEEDDQLGPEQDEEDEENSLEEKLPEVDSEDGKQEKVDSSTTIKPVNGIPLQDITPDFLDSYKLGPEIIKQYMDISIPTSELLIKNPKLLENRWRVVFKLEYFKHGLETIQPKLKQLNLFELAQEFTQFKKRKLSEDSTVTKRPKREPKIVDLTSPTFNHVISTKVKLPKGSYQQTKKEYDTITIPPPPVPDQQRELVPISELPVWAHPVFSDTKTLNAIQSQIYPQAFNSDNNLLICAPTGAGKTNVAMLAMLRTISKYRKNDTIDKRFKIVYIAPLKALVSEQMREFSIRLQCLGITVNQVSGDSNLSAYEIAETQVIVTTPEKWDIITRKNIAIVNMVQLIIIDEIHLLHDERGPVLEAIVSRSVWNQSSSRIVGLSATLPNYRDVSEFIRAPPEGVFYFDASFRPCPLQQQFIGIKEKKAIKKLAAMNEACLEKFQEALAQNHQMIIFVHSRKETFKTAAWLNGKTDTDIVEQSVRRVLESEAGQMSNTSLKQILPTGIGIHHAGLNQHERSVVEDLFAQGHLKVLVSTSTLAWGVNLPAHTVVIKGTETYSPDKGLWVQLSPQDILQMLGRAGRPRYDKNGMGVIITSRDEVQYYMAILNQQLPIESQLLGKLVDTMNGEIVLGTIRSRDDAVEWLGYTYLYIRMLKSPGLYLVGSDSDETLYGRRLDLVHSALTMLRQYGLIEYDGELVTSTELGKIASHFYINYDTIDMYNTTLKPWSTEIDILSVISRSHEFKYIPIRQEERLEVRKLYESCPIPIKETSSDPLAKVNLLLQAYISRLTLEGFALMADMIYITQSAARLARAIYEISLRKNWAGVCKISLNLCKMIERRMWMTHSPLRQFPNVSTEIISATENSHLPFVTYFKLSAEALAEAISLKGNSRRAHDLLQQFPKLTLNHYAQPLSHELVRVQVEVVPDWVWSAVHGPLQTFTFMVEDVNGERILFKDLLIVSKQDENREILIDFTVQVAEPVPPNYFITFINDKWLHSEFTQPIILSDLKLPKKPAGFTKVVQETLLTEVVGEHRGLFELEHFNKFQSHVFDSLYNTDDNTFIGISKGHGKLECTEIAILSHWKHHGGRIIYLNPCQQVVDAIFKRWNQKFGVLDKQISKLTGQVAEDVHILGSNHLVLATPDQFDFVSRRWRQRKVVQSLEMVILDDIHVIGNVQGSIYENTITRLRFISSQVDHNMRFIAFSMPLASGRDFGDYLGCPKQSIYNFDPTDRNIKQILIKEHKHNYSAIEPNSIVFVDDHKTAMEVCQHVISINDHLRQIDLDTLNPYLETITHEKTRVLLENGVGYIHPGLSSTELHTISTLFANTWISTLVIDKLCSGYSPHTTGHVIIWGTETFDGKQQRAVPYLILTVLEMVGCCENGDVTVYTKPSYINHFSRLISGGIPLESYYNHVMHEVFMNEISGRIFKRRQDCIDWLTFSYFYRRVQMNPSFYDVTDTSHQGMSEYLSELVETTVKDLADNGLIDDEDDGQQEDEDQDILAPLNGSLIASHYGVYYLTMLELNKINNATKLRSILEVISSSTEFEELPLRANEARTLESLYKQLPVKSANPDFTSPFFKTFILLQCHFSCVSVNNELARDLEYILSRVLAIIGAAVDVLSSEGYLNTLQVIDLSQMIVQGMWNRDNPLRQLPHINQGILDRCKKYNVATVYDIMALEDDERDDVLQLDDEKLQDVAEFVNKYPNVDIGSHDITGPVVANEPVQVIVEVERDEDMDDLEVVGRIPGKKEQWWVIIGDAQTKQLYGIKRTVIGREKQSIGVEMTIPTGGHHKLTIWCMCDSYLDVDKELQFEVDVE